MTQQRTIKKINWEPILRQMQSGAEQNLPHYPGDLKAALLQQAGLSKSPKGEEIYQLAVEIAQTTTQCDPELVYWFSRLVDLVEPQI